MKFGLVIGQADRIGGMEKQAVLLARELKRRGHDVFLFISDPRKVRCRGDLLNLDAIARKSLYRTRYSKPLSRWLLRRYCRRHGISNLIAFNVESAELAVSAGIGGRIAMSVRGTKFSRDALLARKYRRVASRCDLILTNSDETANMLRQSEVVGERGVRVIHNGIELPEAQPCPKGKTVLYVASIKTVKDPVTFVKACHRVIALDDEVRVTMVGDGNMRPSIEDYIRSHGLESRFVLTGEIPHESIPYRDASVFVNSSLRESSSNSLLEALSFGIPVVATANSGNSEILSQLSRHKLVPVSNVEEMAGAIHSLLDAGSGQRLAIFRESRELIRNRYSVAKMVDGFIEAFSSL